MRWTIAAGLGGSTVAGFGQLVCFQLGCDPLVFSWGTLLPGLLAAAVLAPRWRDRLLAAGITVLVHTTFLVGSGAPLAPSFGIAPAEQPAGAVAVTTPAPTPTRTPSPTPKYAIPPKGALIYEAKFDGTEKAVAGVTVLGGAAIQFGLDSIGIEAKGGTAFVGLTPRALETYVGELELSVASGSKGGFRWLLRQSPDKTQAHILSIDIGAQFVRGAYFEAQSGSTKPLTPDIPIAGLQAGRVFTLAVVAASDGYTVYLDQKQVAKFSAPSFKSGVPVTVNVVGKPGFDTLVKIVGARLYELP